MAIIKEQNGKARSADKTIRIKIHISRFWVEHHHRDPLPLNGLIKAEELEDLSGYEEEFSV